MVSVHLVDATLQLDPLDSGVVPHVVRSITLNAFIKKKEDIPDLQRAGDVLRAHRVKLQEWNNALQLVSHAQNRWHSKDHSILTFWIGLGRTEGFLFPRLSQKHRLQRFFGDPDCQVLIHHDRCRGCASSWLMGVGAETHLRASHYVQCQRFSTHQCLLSKSRT